VALLSHRFLGLIVTWGFAFFFNLDGDVSCHVRISAEKRLIKCH
jgi:hypothetical protein